MNPIVGIGELLWDVYPDGRKVAGGAPFNFAFHCHQLGHPAAVVSRVGDDDLGRELREKVRELGLTDEHIQTDRDHPTGTVQVALGRDGVPAYTITEGVAWDYLEWTDGLGRLAGDAKAVCFGTLAQRADSANIIHAFLSDARFGPGGYAYRVFDVNLRQRYYCASWVKASLFRTHTVKLSREELTAVAELFGWEGGETAELVAQLFKFSAAETRLVIVSRGADGSEVYPERGEPDYEPAAPATVVDTVGAGDAFTAAMVCLFLERRPLRERMRFAAHYASRVCEQPGGTPKVDRAEVERAAFGAA